MTILKHTPVESKDFPGWYDIPGYKMYCANQKGHILNKKTKNFSVGGKAGRYLKVSAYRDGLEKPSLYYVHDLVCRAFHGTPKVKQVVLHKDNNRNNNKPTNLIWGSQSDNILQVYKDGIRPSNKQTVSTEHYPYWLSWSNGNSFVSLEDFDYVSVNSSNIYNVGYDKKTKVLEVEFKSGSTYQYEGVSKSVFTKLVHAFSVGGYFHEHIRNNYSFTKI